MLSASDRRLDASIFSPTNSSRNIIMIDHDDKLLNDQFAISTQSVRTHLLWVNFFGIFAAATFIFIQQFEQYKGIQSKSLFIVTQ